MRIVYVNYVYKYNRDTKNRFFIYRIDNDVARDYINVIVNFLNFIYVIGDKAHTNYVQK